MISSSIDSQTSIDTVINNKAVTKNLIFLDNV